ncbi:hypothetical protein EES41_17105 [Streptomyces sp. ADI95-16]|uniref:DUF5677 domain-containing protein n=1 Tax=Streptomyces sp. ADI95-16 TaxID=1522758 RepID=UPI000F433F98|nr:DUF5677 domain-containing protein [Streptomyces sp. ADI95-16]AYV28445.1 hypothetical protein EES41_17105 [Streptomyces sp. ADI95-16]
MRLFTRREKSSIEEKFESYVVQALHDSNVDESDEDRIKEISSESIAPFAAKVGAQICASITRDRKSFRINNRTDRGFNKRLNRRYRKAFEAYIISTACALEAGAAQEVDSNTSLDENEQATRFALVGLHAKGCRVAGEVYALLCNGYPEGALARARTLHELAVVAGALADSTNDPTHANLAVRYLEHEVIDARRSAIRYQEDHIRLGMKPLDQDYMDELEDRFQSVITKYGREFQKEYGWAKEYCPDANIAGLESKVRMGHMRGYYKLASNEVHAGSRGIFLNRHEFMGDTAWRAGKTNAGLAEPASMALNSVHQITVMLLVKGARDSTDLTTLAILYALDELRTRAGELFLKVAREIGEAELEVRASLRKTL